MRKKSERSIITCPSCNDSFRINKKPRRPQEVGVTQPLEKKNPFKTLETIFVTDGMVTHFYEKTLCDSCGNIFALYLREEVKVKMVERDGEEKSSN